MKKTSSTTKQTKFRLALLLAVLIAALFTLSSCAESLGEYSFEAPEDVTYNIGDTAEPLTVTATVDFGETEGIIEANWRSSEIDEISSDDKFVGLPIRYGADFSNPFPENLPVVFTFTPDISVVGTTYYYLELIYEYDAGDGMATLLGKEGDDESQATISSSMFSVTVVDPNADEEDDSSSESSSSESSSSSQSSSESSSSSASSSESSSSSSSSSNSDSYNFAITSQPTGGSYTAGDSVVLSVSAATNSGNSLHYQWYTSLTNSMEGAIALSGANYNTYTVNSANNANQFYFCRVTDSYGGSSRLLDTNLVNIIITGANPTPTPTPTPTGEELWVAGVLVTPANASDILNDGGKVSYNFTTKTLTLNAAIYYTGTSVSPNAYQNAVIGANFDLTINIEYGTSGISGSTGTTNAKPTAGIYVDGDLTFVGDGVFNITGAHQQHGVIVTGDMLVDVDESTGPFGGPAYGKVIAKGASGAYANTTGATGGNGFSGVHVGGTLTVNDKATLEVEGGTGGTGNNINVGGSGGTTGPGGTGGVGIIATEINVLSGGTLEAIGGFGGTGGGYNASDNGDGSTGGVGNFAYVGVLTNNGTVTITGGEGGPGGAGTGTGGNGGAGYFAFGSGSVLTNNGTATVTGGNGGIGGIGGSTGAGGIGGNGSTAHNGTLQETVAATVNNGANGTNGTP